MHEQQAAAVDQPLSSSGARSSESNGSTTSQLSVENGAFRSPPPPQGTATLASTASHEPSPHDGDAGQPEGRPPAQETAISFLRDARRALQHGHTKSASRITAIARRLGSVPAPQVKADVATFRDTVLALLDLAIAETRVDTAMFLAAYSRSINRHPRLLAALRSGPRYRAAMHALVFDPPHTTNPWPASPNASAGQDRADARSAFEEARDGDEPMSDSSVPRPRVFRSPSTFSYAVSAFVRLHFCPPQFWDAIVTWGVPVMHQRSRSDVPPSAAGDRVQLAGANAAEPGPSTAQRPDWQRKNALTAVKITEMLSLRYAEEAPAEGLDSRPAPRRARALPAAPPPAALREVEDFAAAIAPQLTGDEVAQVIYNYGQVRGKPRPDVLCVLEEAALARAARMSSKAMSQLLAGYVSMRVRPGPMLEDMLTRRLQQMAPSMTIHPLSIMLLQSAKLGATLPEAPFAALVARMDELVAGGSFDTTKFAPRLLWACAVYTAVHGAGFGRRAQLGSASWALLQAFAELWEAGRLGCEPDGSTLLRQAHNSIEVLSREHKWKIEDGTAVSRFVQHCRRSAQEYATRQLDVAHMHGMRLKIFQHLQQICAESGTCTVSQKVLWGDDAHFSYIVVHTGEQWISVELEVPANVVCCVAGDVTGVSAKPLLRNWALARWGGAALSIVEEEWDAATLAAASFVECLRGELRARGAVL